MEDPLEISVCEPEVEVATNSKETGDVSTSDSNTNNCIIA